jgi:ribosomal protein S18 acetylase RimI-like enzyme
VVDPVVRRAVVDDVGQLSQLEHEARAALSERRGGQRWLDTHPSRGVQWAERGVDRAVYVAVHDALVVGYLVAGHAEKIARIEDVYVAPDWRDLGFGDALLERAMTDAREAGCELIEGEALPGDREIKNLYERAGVTARLIFVSRKLV